MEKEIKFDHSKEDSLQAVGLTYEDLDKFLCDLSKAIIETNNEKLTRTHVMEMLYKLSKENEKNLIIVIHFSEIEIKNTMFRSSLQQLFNDPITNLLKGKASLVEGEEKIIKNH